MDFRFSQFEVMTTAGSFFVSLLFVCVFVEASDIEQEVGIAAAEVAVGLAILVVVYRRRKTVYVDDLNEMRG